MSRVYLPTDIISFYTITLVVLLVWVFYLQYILKHKVFIIKFIFQNKHFTATERRTMHHIRVLRNKVQRNKKKLGLGGKKLNNNLLLTLIRFKKISC